MGKREVGEEINLWRVIRNRFNKFFYLIYFWGVSEFMLEINYNKLNKGIL